MLRHHLKLDVCNERPKYRQGRKYTAVKVYSVSDESIYLLIQGVPSIGIAKELHETCSVHGNVLALSALEDYPSEQFTKTYLLKYECINSARVAKRKLDDLEFYGGILHVCYAPEYETVDETRWKLQERRMTIARKCRQLEKEKESAASARRNEDVNSFQAKSGPSSSTTSAVSTSHSHSTDQVQNNIVSNRPLTHGASKTTRVTHGVPTTGHVTPGVPTIGHVTHGVPTIGHETHGVFMEGHLSHRITDERNLSRDSTVVTSRYSFQSIEGSSYLTNPYATPVAGSHCKPSIYPSTMDSSLGYSYERNEECHPIVESVEIEGLEEVTSKNIDQVTLSSSKGRGGEEQSNRKRKTTAVEAASWHSSSFQSPKLLKVRDAVRESRPEIVTCQPAVKGPISQPPIKIDPNKLVIRLPTQNVDSQKPRFVPRQLSAVMAAAAATGHEKVMADSRKLGKMQGVVLPREVEVEIRASSQQHVVDDTTLSIRKKIKEALE